MFRSSTHPTRSEQEHRHACSSARRSIASVELITTAALALSTAVAVTAVSIGIARAEALGSVSKGDGASFAIALLIGLLLSGVSAVSALMAVHPRSD